MFFVQRREQEWIELPSVDVYLDPSLALVAASAAASGSGYEGSRGGSAKAAAGSWSAGSPAKISKGGVGSRGRSGRGGATGGGDSVARMTPGAVVAWLENAGLGEYSQARAPSYFHIYLLIFPRVCFK